MLILGVSIARRVHGVRGLPERANRFWPASYPCRTGYQAWVSMARKVHGVRGLVLACLLLLQDRGHKGVSTARKGCLELGGYQREPILLYNNNDI